MEEYVECPICKQKFRIIYKNHLQKHGYNSREEILKDFPNMKFYSEWLSNKNRETANINCTTPEARERSRKLMKATSDKLFKDNPEYRIKYSEIRKEIWKREDYRNKISKSWTDERRKEFSEWSKKSNKERLQNPEYREKNAKQFASIGGHGIKTTYNGKHLKSSYELIVVKYLDEETNINYEYEPMLFDYTINNENHKYIPDIYIKDLNLFIEIKPKYKINEEVNQIKRQSVIDKGYNYKFLTEDDLDNLENYFNSLFESSTTIESIIDN